jgi:hypothetical protein
MILQVETDRTGSGDPEPRAFMLGGRRLAVAGILDRWPAADHSYFKVETEDGSNWILRYDAIQQQWEMTLFRA